MSSFDMPKPKSLKEMQREVLGVNQDNGWFDSERTILEGHMLIVTEVAEASEAYRMYGLKDSFSLDKNGEKKPEGVGSEYADILIRLLDQCYRDGVDLEEQYEIKIAYNRKRGYRHGGKKI